MGSIGRSQRTIVAACVALMIGAVAGLIAGGSARGLTPWGGSDSNGANAAAEPTPEASTEQADASTEPGPALDPGTPPADPAAGPLTEGAVAAPMGAAELTSEISHGAVKTQDGAVAAFSSYAVWLIASPAAASNPSRAAEVVGGTLINSADAQLLANMQRKPGDRFAVDRGAYRVLGYSGDELAPTQVMVEVAAPLTVGGNARWSIVGGVVTWTPTGWQLVSIMPKEIPQPTADHSDARAFTKTERAETLEGIGWRLFKPAKRS